MIQQAQQIPAHDLGLLLRRYLAVEQGVVLGDADMHQGEGSIAAEADPALIWGHHTQFKAEISKVPSEFQETQSTVRVFPNRFLRPGGLIS